MCSIFHAVMHAVQHTPRHLSHHKPRRLPLQSCQRKSQDYYKTSAPAMPRSTPHGTGHASRQTPRTSMCERTASATQTGSRAALAPPESEWAGGSPHPAPERPTLVPQSRSPCANALHSDPRSPQRLPHPPTHTSHHPHGRTHACERGRSVTSYAVLPANVCACLSINHPWPAQPSPGR